MLVWVCTLGEKQNKTKPHHFLAWGLIWNQGCPEIENVAENWDQVAHNTVIWRMLSHIRTQKTLRALPCELLESHTNSPCWETNSVSLFVGSLCWGYSLLGLWVPYSHCCLAISPTYPLTSAPEPLLLGMTSDLFFFLYSPLSLCFPQNLLWWGWLGIGNAVVCWGWSDLFESGPERSLWFILGKKLRSLCVIAILWGSESGMTPVAALGLKGHWGGSREIISVEHLLCSILSALQHLKPIQHST